MISFFSRWRRRLTSDEGSTLVQEIQHVKEDMMAVFREMDKDIEQ